MSTLDASLLINPINVAGAAGGGSSAAPAFTSWNKKMESMSNNNWRKTVQQNLEALYAASQAPTNAIDEPSRADSAVHSALSMPTNFRIPPGLIPSKRTPDDSGAGYEVPEGVGIIAANESAVNGSFKSQPHTNPQKSIFLTYKSSNEESKNSYNNCKLPLKINIPGGDFGLYQITVNEVLFRHDAPLFTGDEWLNVELSNLTFEYELIDSANSNHVFKTDKKLKLFQMNGGTKVETTNVTMHFTVPSTFKKLLFSYLNLTLFKNLLQSMIMNYTTKYQVSFDKDEIPNSWTIDSTVYTLDVTTKPNSKTYNENSVFTIQENYASGNGLTFLLGPERLNQTVKYKNGSTTINAYINLIANTGKMRISCTDHLRSIMSPFSTTHTVESSTCATIDKTRAKVLVGEGVNVPYLNFGGPLVFMLNTSAQTTCPIANETGAQFNTCALSYNTSLEAQQLVQMTSNIPLVLKEGNDFRVWLTDMYGNPINLQSPMYIQVTIEPFVNSTSTASNT